MHALDQSHQPEFCLILEHFWDGKKNEIINVRKYIKLNMSLILGFFNFVRKEKPLFSY